MARATVKGQAKLLIIEGCELNVPRAGTILFTAMPSVTDSKGAEYASQKIIGRSMPLLTYSNSETRTLSIDIHLVTTGSTDTSSGATLVPGTIESNMRILRAISDM